MNEFMPSMISVPEIRKEVAVSLVDDFLYTLAQHYFLHRICFCQSKE